MYAIREKHLHLVLIIKLSEKVHQYSSNRIKQSAKLTNLEWLVLELSQENPVVSKSYATDA